MFKYKFISSVFTSFYIKGKYFIMLLLIIIFVKFLLETYGINGCLRFKINQILTSKLY